MNWNEVVSTQVAVDHATSLAEGEASPPSICKSTSFAPVWNGRIRAIARPLNVARQVSRYVCDIVRDDDKLIAQVASTVMTLSSEEIRHQEDRRITDPMNGKPFAP